MKKKILPLILSLLLLAACGENPPAESGEAVSPAPSESVQPSYDPPAAGMQETVVSDFTNPLTGEPIAEEKVTQRPVAVMLNNIRIAMPMHGNSQADILYEVLAEGGITRMMGVYQDVSNVGDIGSVRSSRPYYLELALGLDAVYLHAGGSERAYEDISKWNVTALDCVRTTAYSDIFWRDQSRVKNNGYEHSVLTNGEKIAENFPNYSFRKEHEAGYSLEYTFVSDGTPDGDTANKVTVNFSSSKTTTFTFDETSGKYLAEEYGKTFIDGNDQSQVAVTNLLVLKTRCKAYDDYGRLEVDLSGFSGEGWYACGGKYIPIRWFKKDLNSPIVYTLEDGSALDLQIGNSYVGIIPLSNSIVCE